MAEPHDADLIPDEIRRLLGDDWDYHADVEPVMAEGQIHSMACKARYHDGRLVVDVNVDRGAYSILVGTDRPDDMYPFEDVAVHRNWSNAADLHTLIANDDNEAVIEPLMPWRQALQLLNNNAGVLNDLFAPENGQLRDGLRAVACKFRNAAWPGVDWPD